WPQLLLPQHLTPPPLVRAQVWPSPAAIAATPLESPLTSTGTWRSVLLLSPSSPYSFEPQHFAPPLPVTAQVWKRPALIAITPLERPLTFTGAYCSVVELLPSWPKSLALQHFTPPPVVKAQVCSPPVA